MGPGEGEGGDRGGEGGGGMGVDGGLAEAGDVGLDDHLERVHLVHLDLGLVAPGGGVGEERLGLGALRRGAGDEPPLGAHHPADRDRPVEEVAEAVGGDEIGEEALAAGDVAVPDLAGEEVAVALPALHHLLAAGGVLRHLDLEGGGAPPERGELGPGGGEVGPPGGEHVVDLVRPVPGGAEVGAGVGPRRRRRLRGGAAVAGPGLVLRTRVGRRRRDRRVAAAQGEREQRRGDRHDEQAATVAVEKAHGPRMIRPGLAPAKCRGKVRARRGRN